MDPSNMYTTLLGVLQNVEVQLTSPAGSALLQGAPPNQHQAAMRALLDVHQARLALGNAALQSIADELKANEKAIADGTAALKAAAADLKSVTDIINAAADVVNVVAQIVPMV